MVACVTRKRARRRPRSAIATSLWTRVGAGVVAHRGARITGVVAGLGAPIRAGVGAC